MADRCVEEHWLRNDIANLPRPISNVTQNLKTRIDTLEEWKKDTDWHANEEKIREIIENEIGDMKSELSACIESLEKISERMDTLERRHCNKCPLGLER